MKSSLILASAVLAIAGNACQVAEGTENGGPTAGAGGSPAATSDAGSGDDSDSGSGGNANGTGGAVAGTGGVAGSIAATDGGGTGGTTSTSDGGPSGPSVCDGTGTRNLTADKSRIDNFEGAMLNPGWSTFSDVPGALDVAKIKIEAGGAAGTARAAHYAGTGALSPATGGYGVGAVYNMAIDRSRGVYCVDISPFDGVTFWAKANQQPGARRSNQLSVNFVLPETNAVSVGGDCPDESKKCYSHPRRTVTLTSDWARYSVSFAEAAGGSATVANRVQSLAFLTVDADWDYALDEIQLYKGTPPSSP